MSAAGLEVSRSWLLGPSSLAMRGRARQPLAVGAHLPAVEGKGTRRNEPALARQGGNGRHSLGLPQGVQLLGCHARSFDDGRIAAAGEPAETQTDDLLCLQAGLPSIK